MKNSLHYPAGNDVPLSVHVGAGESLASEPLMFAIGREFS